MDTELAKMTAMAHLSEEIDALLDMLPLRHRERDRLVRSGAMETDLQKFDRSTAKFAEHVRKRSAQLRIKIPV